MIGREIERCGTGLTAISNRVYAMGKLISIVWIDGAAVECEIERLQFRCGINWAPVYPCGAALESAFNPTGSGGPLSDCKPAIALARSVRRASTTLEVDKGVPRLTAQVQRLSIHHNSGAIDIIELKELGAGQIGFIHADFNHRS